MFSGFAGYGVPYDPNPMDFHSFGSEACRRAAWRIHLRATTAADRSRADQRVAMLWILLYSTSCWLSTLTAMSVWAAQVDDDTITLTTHHHKPTARGTA
jgi:hypothetical protein